jgi:hypothetical protein
MNEEQGLMVRNRRKVISIVVLILLLTAYYLLIIRNPLPSDEQMIEHFQKHRSDIEELVRRYRSYSTEPDVDHSTWFRKGDTMDIMEQARIDWLAHGAIWLPNPYSIESAKLIKDDIKHGEGNMLFNKYGGLMVSLLPRKYYSKFHLRYLKIWKDIYFIPEVPRIEDDELLWPFNTRGKYTARRRILSSLNGFPENWKAHECVFKQIETHWFLRLCNGR